MYEFRNALEKLAQFDSAMPLSALQTLIWVALNEGRHQYDLERDLKLSTSAAGRSIAWWGDWRDFKAKRRGPGLVESYPDPSDKRYRVVRLTDAGKEFMKELFHG